MKVINYSSATLNDLEEIFDIKQIKDRTIFKEWFEKKYDFKKNDNDFLETLIERNYENIDNYTELELIAKFIAPLLYEIDFTIKNKHIKDWFEISLKYECKDFSFNGRCDFIVAKGYDKPIKPYFFIQEFKQNSSTFPKYQLLSEMIAATLIDNSNQIKGAYIVGSMWVFMIVEKTSSNSYNYYLSKKYDSMEIEDLTQIYQNLQNIKNELVEN